LDELDRAESEGKIVPLSSVLLPPWRTGPQ
jgi:hypothetical protein